MNERLKVLDFKYNVVLGTFVFFLILSLLSPLSGLDWGNYVIGSKGILYSLKHLDFTFGGVISGILTSLFSYNKGVFNLISAFIFSLLVKNINDLYGRIDNKYYYLLAPLFLLLVGVDTFAYNYVSVSGTTAFTFPSIAILIYFIYIYRKEMLSEPLTRKDFVLFGILSLYIIFSTAYIGIGFLLGNIIFYVYKVVSIKKIPKRYFILLLFQILICVINLIVIDKSLLYSSLPLLVSKIPSFIELTFSKNIIIIILGAIPINYYLNDVLKNFSYKRVIVVLFDLLLIFSLSYNFINYSPVNISLVINKYMGVFALENTYYLIYFILYMLLFLLTIIHFVGKKTARNYLIVFIFMGLFVSSFKIFSPSYDDGNNILFIISMITSIGVLFNNIKLKLNTKVVKGVLLFLIIYNLSIMGFVKYIDYKRTDIINKGLKDNESTIEVVSCPVYLVYRYNPVTIFQEKSFREYYKIPDDKNIDLKNFGIIKIIRESVE